MKAELKRRLKPTLERFASRLVDMKNSMQRTVEILEFIKDNGGTDGARKALVEGTAMASSKSCEMCAHFHGKAVGRCQVANTMVTPYTHCDKWEKKSCPNIGVARPSDRYPKPPIRK